ncbi:hypothetical protein EGK14_06190 [Erwinia sp. 198]|nr:hypothetical protein EGK14_06190 [Erwinia sp. 198]
MISFGFLTHYVSYFACTRGEDAIKQTTRTVGFAKKLLNINICASVISNKLAPVNIKARRVRLNGKQVTLCWPFWRFPTGQVKKEKSPGAASLYP